MYCLKVHYDFSDLKCFTRWHWFCVKKYCLFPCWIMLLKLESLLYHKKAHMYKEK